MKRFRFLTLTSALAVLLAGAVFAQGPGPGGRGRGPDGFGPGSGLPLRALNLTETQQQQIRTLTQQSRQQNRPTVQRLRTAMDAQRKAVATIPVNEALIRSTTQELAEAQAEMAIQQARLQTEIFGMLTPGQQAEAKKLQTERETRLQQRQQRQRN
jgi:Spy/CpxP family protein refolding chaperone